jgi:predicted small lipoprotein YifL
LAFRRPIVLLAMAAVAALSLAACGRKGALEKPPGPAGVQPAPEALSGPPPGPVASDTSAAPPTPHDTVARTGFDAQGNPAATPGQNKPFFLDPLLQ